MGIRRLMFEPVSLQKFDRMYVTIRFSIKNQNVDSQFVFPPYIKGIRTQKGNPTKTYVHLSYYDSCTFPIQKCYEL